MKIPYYKNIMFLDQDTPVILQFRIGTRRILRMKFGLKIKTSFQASSSSEGISLYIHLPFAKAYVLLWL
jgi:hypothetical protein